ncbi:HGxxPAAW family protein [Yaniella halotolerans]|uniref:HGxxPAAW family protein n=1 Tax=Yaniella halotolerans TaxID=225453 RepID=UPI0003B4E4DB|nr:HGxxPAAW family protein [Yaniella halotolerans]
MAQWDTYHRQQLEAAGKCSGGKKGITQMANMTEELKVDEYGRILNDPTHDESPSHGNSPAAWALVMLVLVGLVIAGISALASGWVVMWIGIGIAVLGLPVAFFMRLAGKGANGDYKG